MDQAIFWVEWACLASPSVLAKVGRVLCQEALRDPELDSTLHFASIRAAAASWPYWWCPINTGTHIPKGCTQVEQACGDEASRSSEDAPGSDIWLDDLTQRLIKVAKDALASISSTEACTSVPSACSDFVEAKKRLEQVALCSAGLQRADEGAVERAAGEALKFVGSALQVLHGTHSLSLAKKALQDTQDVLILACSRFLDPESLQKKGIPLSLRKKVCEACDEDVVADNGFWSRLGCAKYHLFTHGVRFSNRKPKKNRSPADHKGVSATVGEDLSEGDQDVFEMQRLRDPVVKVRNTFIQFDVKSESEASHSESHAKSSCKTWPRLDRTVWALGSTAALAPRAQVHEVLKEVEKESGPLGVEVDDCAIQVMDALLEELTDIRARALVWQWVELFKWQPRMIFSGSHMFRNLLEAVFRVVQRFATNPALVRHCCVALGNLVEIMPDLSADVCKALLKIMDCFPRSSIIQDVCVAKIAYKVCWVSGEILGISIPGDQPGKLPIETRKCMLERVQLALKHAQQGYFVESEDVVSHKKNICCNAHRIFTRMFHLPEVLKYCGEEPDLLNISLSEVFHALDISSGPLSEYWSVDFPGTDIQQKRLHKDMLLQVAEQLSPAQKREAHWVLPLVSTWVQSGREGAHDPHASRYQMERRMLLAGILFEGDGVVASVVFQALEKAFDTMPKGSPDDGRIDEELISAGLRASIELKCLDLLEPELSGEILWHILDSRFTPWTKHCIGACAGTLGVFAGDASCSKVQLDAVDQVIQTFDYWFHKNLAESLIFECLWALNKILAQADPSFSQQWARPCAERAKKVLDDEYYKRWDQDEGCTTSEFVKALREAEKLLQKSSEVSGQIRLL